ncbi:MAG: type II toxin-antitoxin system RelE/ParE family toxin [Clostridia bacterium]|nr:type II toxin-antitoxin system RelE/ParE family toxin [Clostridia bacterium]
MYKVQFLPLAKNDLIETVRYIANDLYNKQAAYKLADEIIKATDTLADFPYAYPAYIPIRQTKNEYRKISIQNYLVFYTVDEKNKIVTISRIVYAKRNYNKLIK